MAVKDFMKPGYGPRMGCKILTVDPQQRKIEAILKDGAAVQVAVFDTPGFFVWPKVGERWTIHKYNGIWMLNHRLGTEDDYQVDDLQPGEGKIDADIIKTPTGKSVIIVDDAKVTAGQVIGYQNGTWTPIDQTGGTGSQGPQGPKGDTGPQGSQGNVGATGSAGPSNVLTVNSTTTGDAGTNANVTIRGTSPAQSLSFTIPRGNTGATGGLGTITSAIPTSGLVDNEEIFYSLNGSYFYNNGTSTTDSHDTIVWHLKYNQSSSKWYFIGGPSLEFYQGNDMTTLSSSTYYGVTGGITLPAGAWQITFGANAHMAFANTSSNPGIWLAGGYVSSGTVVPDAEIYFQSPYTNTTTDADTSLSQSYLLRLTSSRSIRAFYKTPNLTGVTINNCYIKAMPIYLT